MAEGKRSYSHIPDPRGCFSQVGGPVLGGKIKVHGSVMNRSSSAVSIRSKESVHFRPDKV